jgi:hypothetical protein
MEGSRMSLTYYSHRLGRERLKRRYVWGILGFTCGLLSGAIFAWLM